MFYIYYIHVLLLFLFYYSSFYLSLNKADCLGDDDQTLKTLGLVSGDLIHLVSTDPDNFQGNFTTIYYTVVRYTRGQIHARNKIITDTYRVSKFRLFGYCL